MQYFDHDTMAGGDDKIIALRLEHGGAAVDAFWVILEQIYRDETALVFFGNRHAKRTLSHRLNTDEETLDKWVSTMLEVGLLEADVKNPDALISQRAKDNISKYQEKCETARQNGKKGGRKPNGNQPANQTLTVRETKKRKEKKDIGSHKENQISDASGVAASVETAPPSAKPLCPLCGIPVWKNVQTRKWRCDNCMDEFQDEAVTWR